MNPSHLLYTENHEWLRDDGAGVYAVGITDYAAEQLGDITYVELPSVGEEFAQDEEVAVVESVKAATDVYAPVGGRVVAVNEALEEHPEQVNASPYEDGWFFKLKGVIPADLESLMTAAAYDTFLKGI
jgi:glycine cleavage system H protein